MASFNARRAPNVSQYIANLNAVPSAQDLAAQSEISLSDGDLDFLTNTEFFDFDSFNPNINFTQPPVPDVSSRKPSVAAIPGVQSPAYQFGDFQTYPPSATNSSPSNSISSPNAALQAHYPPGSQLQYNTAPQAGDKRKATIAGVTSPTTPDYDDPSRAAAEEDKRRRNTAASARFRVKKKQREQALEKQAKEMADKVQQLEGKVQQLEMENKWLKGLITEKGSGRKSGSSTGRKAEELAGAAKEKETEERSTEQLKRGIGTESSEEEEEEEEEVKSEA